MPNWNISKSKNDTLVCLFSGFGQVNYYHDLIFGIVSFASYGIPLKNILVFLPSSSFTAFNSVLPLPYRTYDVLDFETQLAKESAKYIICVMTGHGSRHGVATEVLNPVTSSPYFISPSTFLSTIRSVNNVELAIGVLGVCVAGVFNYLRAYKNGAQAETCLIGATGLHNSLNAPVPEFGNLHSNVFLAYFHYWFANQEDIDGDGNFSLMDCFKYAGARTYSVLSENRGSWFQELTQAERTLNGGGLNPLIADALKKKISSNLSAIHTIQEPWALNSNKMRDEVIL